VAFLFATELSAFGRSGRGGGVDVELAVVAAVGAVVLEEPVSPTEALVWPPLRSHGFGGDGEAISPVIASHRPS
jgi:hypothetical protein